MNHDQFTYWLQGFVEMNNGNMPNQWQWRMIKDHLQTCFVKVTPTYPSAPLTSPYKTLDFPTDPLFPPYKVTCSIDGSKPKGGGGGC